MYQITRELFHVFMSYLPTPIAVKLLYIIHQRRVPNTKNPKRFNEKIIRRKLIERDLRFSERADKVLVKDFVARKLGKAYVIPTIWSGAQLPAREHRNWPLPYVLKSNNGSGTNYFVRSKSDVNWDVIEAKCAKWLSDSHASWAGEWLYTNIQPKLLVEPFINAIGELPLDYKFFVFGGRVEYIQVDTDRETDHKRTFFDRQWNRQGFSLGFPLSNREISRPICLDEMIRAAEQLAEDFPFVRVDLYEIDGQPLFGEMTFYPGAGCERFMPDAYDFEFGKLWK